MTRSIAYCILIIVGGVSIILIATKPEWVSDDNKFLLNFVNHELINVLGVILAITLASAAQIHLAFNRIEERYKVRNALEKSRRELRQDTYWLIALFLIGVAIAVVKPICGDSRYVAGFFNMAALFILLFHVLLLISLTNLVFAIEPEFPDEDA